MKGAGEHGYPRYWAAERETMPVEQRRGMILERVQAQLHRAYETMPFYRRLYDEHSLHPADVHTLDDFTQRVPIVTKDMLRADQQEFPPYGSYRGTPDHDVARIYGSSGTTGVPTLYAISTADWDRARDAQAMALWAMGVRPNDTVHFVFPFGMFIGGWALLHGCEAIGCTNFTAGAMDTRRQIDMMRAVRPSVLAGTPSYCMHLGEVAGEMSVDLTTTGLRTVLVGGEPGGSLETCRAKIKEIFGDVVVADTGNTSECFPTQMNSSCSEEVGVHVFEDEVFCEIVEPGDPAHRSPEGSPGATVYTTLWRESQPMIRFWSGDESQLTYEPCPCGRTYPRLPRGITGRVDDMLLIRGANVYPSTIDEAVRRVPNMGAEYRIVVEKRGALDELILQLEGSPPAYEGHGTTVLSDAVVDSVRRVTGLRCSVEVVPLASLERHVFKARRVIDRRG
jgi:phenylacetate-CoA ligase